jgi:hypothetical protein
MGRIGALSREHSASGEMTAGTRESRRQRVFCALDDPPKAIRAARGLFYIGR